MAESAGEIPLSSLDMKLLLYAIAVLVLAYLAARIMTFILERASERAWKYRITVKMAIPLVKFSIYGLAFYYILKSVLEVSTLQLVAFSGILGAVVGFGMKDIFAGVLGGIILTLDKPYQVGDKIRVGEHYGEVKDIGLRATRLVTPSDDLVSIPNQVFLYQAVANANSGNQEMMVVVDMFIDSEADARVAMKIAREAMVTSRYIYLADNRSVSVFLKDFPFYRRVRVKGYVFDLRHEFDLEADVTRRAWEAMTEAGIKPPRVKVPEVAGPM
jgi:small-conductance mechanosensitive channel